MSSENIPVRDAATIIVIRDRHAAPSVLMGQRGKAAVFMPDKVVFPGGAVDPGDAAITLAGPLPDACARRLGPDGATFAAAGIRELWEETGQVAGCRADWAEAPGDWRGFAATGHRPDARGLRYVFRAITPPGRPRRFDARFFTLDAESLASDPDDFSAAGDELANLKWIPIEEARGLDLPYVTAIVLAEVAARLPSLDTPDRIPFFDGDAPEVRDAAR
ncbi:8-oxo-dGTP pyrophosphatase MutT (NUDIX family) [Palleronia aestuarii]|uniref:8-oxo-dGTP pyrophosphatase MutT (NUDIX family) n=1 Tax=Palleronia aestuarii TaxID=568105 RepID=A0A2W7N8H5_9RHOB|nr:NUDIX hydrolase [Palleronia aestuarii]PZX16340.1 8-oxo-dGTP pyrophosphatase MutT (NUDIX family) [Palleronia aestuarii]